MILVIVMVMGCKRITPLNQDHITLEQAYAQGGVRNYQVLRLKQSDYITDTETYAFHTDMRNPLIGLLIDSRFEIQPRGKVILEDPLENSISVIGLLIVGENAHLINHGKIIVEKSIEAYQFIFGINCGNKGRFDNFGHVHFKGVLTAGSTGGIFINTGSTFTNRGNIVFENDLTSEILNGFGIVCEKSSFITGNTNGSTLTNESNATIEFKGLLTAKTDLNGILIGTNSTVTNRGNIVFEQDLTSETDKVLGIRCDKINTGTNGGALINESGATIEFKGALTATNTLNGILISDGSIETDGSITYINDDLAFNPSPATEPPISGTGSITYGNGTYYPV